MKLRFLLDEHVNRAIQRQLRRLDARMEVLAIGDLGAPPAGTSDPDILGWLQENGYMLVTENRGLYQCICLITLPLAGTSPASFGSVPMLALDTS